MELVVVKIGAVMLDFAHASGLALLLDSVTQSPVEMSDVGSCYLLKVADDIRRLDLEQCISDLFQIPSAEALRCFKESPENPPLSVLNLDGIMAVLFTSPGIRAVSVADILSKQQFNPETAEQSLAKAAAACKRWTKSAVRQGKARSDWLDDLLRSYASNQPSSPIPIIASSTDITVPMTVDPIFGYSTRRPVSDGLIIDKKNVSLRGSSRAPLLIIIGAIRLLRAQRAAEGMVCLYMPIAKTITLTTETALPLLGASPHSIAQTLAQQWLAPAWRTAIPEARCEGLAYQVMQTQGAQQSISLSRGYLNYDMLRTIERDAGLSIINLWNDLLRHDQGKMDFEIGPLIDALLHRRLSSWLEHLSDVAHQAYTGLCQSLELYSLAEIREVTRAMSGSLSSPLRVVLERTQGTLRFGRALRLLGRYNLASLHELIELLDAARDQEGLLEAVAQVAQECELASGRTEFMLVPDEHDLAYLLDDVEQFGARTLGRILIVLSAVRYPATKQENTTQGVTIDESD